MDLNDIDKVRASQPGIGGDELRNGLIKPVEMSNEIKILVEKSAYFIQYLYCFQESND